MAVDVVEVELVGDLLGSGGLWQVLLVGEYQQDGVGELGRLEHLPQLLTGLAQAVCVVAVDHEDDGSGVQKVVAPQATDLVERTTSGWA